MTTYQIIASIVCLILTVLYFVRFGIKHKVLPPSLSETSYITGKYWFMGYCFSTLLLMPPMFELVSPNLQFCVFLMFGGLMMAGASPLFKEGTEKSVHSISALISFAGFLVYMCVEMDWWLRLLYLVPVFGLTKLKPQSFTLFAEMMAIIAICIMMLV